MEATRAVAEEGSLVRLRSDNKRGYASNLDKKPKWIVCENG